MSPAAIQSRLSELVKLSGAAGKLPVVTDLFRALTPTEAKYVIKIITGDLRIGLKENTVEEAIAKAFDRTIGRRCAAPTWLSATSARRRSWPDAGSSSRYRSQLFRPLKFMLATPAETEDEVFAKFSGPFYVEDKYDGIRGQLHLDNSRASLFSRTLDDVSHQFPEIVEAARNAGLSLIVDGEVVAFKDGQVLPFAFLQKRLGRKKPPDRLLARGSGGS